MSDYNSAMYSIPNFLILYQTFPCLWDMRNVQYRNNTARKKALHQLMEKVGLTDIYVLRRRIRSLRCTYNQELAKMRLTPIFIPKLEWFALAHSFLSKNARDYRGEERVGDEIFQLTPSSSPPDEFTIHVKDKLGETWKLNKDDVEINGPKKRKLNTDVDHGDAIQSKGQIIMNPTSPCETSGQTLLHEANININLTSKGTQTRQDDIFDTPAATVDDFSMFGQYIYDGRYNGHKSKNTTFQESKFKF